MASRVDPFRNPQNFGKYLLFYFEPGCNVIIRAILWCTGGENELKKRLNEAKKKSLQTHEIKNLQEYLRGEEELKNFDLTFYFKISQLACGLTQIPNDIWNGNCPIQSQDELEYLLFKLKYGRNELAHASTEYKNLTNLQVEEKSAELKDLLTKILEKAGEKADNVSTNDIQKEIKDMQLHLERIRKGENIDKSLEPYVRDLILNDLKNIYEKELESSFQHELKGYSIPYLTVEIEDYSKIPSNLPPSRLSDIHYSSQVTAVLGEAGAGKTALTKFVLQSWLTGKTESLVGLADFDIVLRLQCNNIRSSDMNQFFEEHFLKAAFYFCNTSTLSRHFIEYKVFWIMDGFDESTSEFCGLLESVIKYLPPTHNVLITARPNVAETLRNDYFPKMVIMRLEKLHETNISEILKKRINDKEKEFTAHYGMLATVEKELLKTPINFVLYLDLWQKDPHLVAGYYTLTKLYKHTTDEQLRELEEKLYLHKSEFVTKDDLNRAIKFWFYGCLCKLSFINTAACKFIFEFSEIEELKNEAYKGHLLPSLCVSTFFEENLTVFKHASLQYYYASIFMKNLERYSDFNIEKEVPNEINFATVELIENYIQLITEDDSINNDSDKSFVPIQKYISKFDKFEQGYLWVKSSIECSFNEHFMEHVSRVQNIFHADILEINRSSFLRFLSFISPSKIVIENNLNEKDRNILLKCLRQFEYGKFQVELTESCKNYLEDIKTQIMNRYENTKHQFYHYEIVTSVIIQVMRWLYVGQETLKKHLADLVEDNKSDLCISSREIYLLKELANGNCKIEELDPDLLLKVTKLIYEGDDSNNSDWTKLRAPFNYNKIEFNKLIENFERLPHGPHPAKEKFSGPEKEENKEESDYNSADWADFHKCELYTEIVAHNITYSYMNGEEELRQFQTNILSMVSSHKTNYVITEQLKKDVKICIEKKIGEFTTEPNFSITQDSVSVILESILSGAGKGANIESVKISEAIENFQERLRYLSSIRRFDIISTTHAKNIIIKELTTKYENGKTYHEKEMGRYIPATLVEEGGDGKKIKLSDISFHDSQRIFVRSNSGMGKSAMTRFIFSSWVTGEMDALVWLKSFDIVFVVDGIETTCKFVSELLQFLLPKSCNIFPTISLLMKQLDRMNVLWICDGFNYKARFLFQDLSERFSTSHKFLATARSYPSNGPNTHSLFKLIWKIYTIDLFSDENIDDLLAKLIPESTNIYSLKSRLDGNSDLLRIPFYLSTYVELTESSETFQLYSNCKLNEAMLLINITNLRLNQMKESIGCSNSEELTRKVDNWFYGSFCRQCFNMIYKRQYYIQRKDLNIIGEGAREEDLDSQICLDFFLIREVTEVNGLKYDFIHEKQLYILASFFFKKWKDYPSFPEGEPIKRGSLKNTAFMLNSFITMYIYEDLNKQYAIEAASKIASICGLNDQCVLWYKICVMNNFQENVMNFVQNILSGCYCYVLHYDIRNISEMVKFFNFFSFKTIRFTSIYINEDIFSKEEYLDLLKVLQERALEIFIGPIHFMSESILTNPCKFKGIKVLGLMNDVASLNITFFEGTVKDLLLLENHLEKLKNLDLIVSSADSYHKLCQILPTMDQLVEINLIIPLGYYSSIRETYPVDFVTRTILTCREPNTIETFLLTSKVMKGETTSKFRRLVVKNWSRVKLIGPDGVTEVYRDLVNSFQSIINERFSDTDFAPEDNFMFFGAN